MHTYIYVYTKGVVLRSDSTTVNKLQILRTFIDTNNFNNNSLLQNSRTALNVNPQKTFGYESLTAQGATVRPLAGMVPFVNHQRRTLREALPALPANVRLFAAVHALVQREIALLRETLPADRARVRLVTGVDAQVLLQVFGARQALPAHVAQHRILAGMRSHVQNQALPVRELLVAYLALVRRRPERLRVNALLVRDQEAGVRKASRANLALERHRARVRILVLLEQIVRDKLFVANIALILIVPLVVVDVQFQGRTISRLKIAGDALVNLIGRVGVEIMKAQLKRVLVRLIALLARVPVLAMFDFEVLLVASRRGELPSAHHALEVVLHLDLGLRTSFELVLVIFVVLD
uniref:Uncharacterized protein n=1 Tax=Photinus pyralis TaxID=7054 RepID=A0A1Y1KRF5_PHOPY